MATLFERLGAYLVDIIIVSFLLGLVSYGLPESSFDVNEKMSELESQLLNNEITSKEYFNEYSLIVYESQSSSKLSFGISLAFSIAYFVVFQTLFNGQTFGKKLLRIKVVNKDDNKPVAMWRMFVRSLFTMSIFSGILNLLLIFILSKSTYAITYLSVSIIETFFIIATIICVLYKKDKRGLHDMMAGTSVIKEG